MKTSQVAIIAVMVLVLGAMCYIYLTEQEKQVRVHQKLKTNDEDNNRFKSLETQMKTQQYTYEERISNLKIEIAQLKTQLDAVQDLPEPAAAVSDSAEVEALRAEVDRLKNQNQLLRLESGLLIKGDQEEKAEELLIAHEIAEARTVGKIHDISLTDHFVVIDPVGQPNFSTQPGKKEKLMVRRDGKLLVKLTVDYLEASTNQYVAQIDKDATTANLEALQKGDEIIFAPKTSQNELPEDYKEPVLPEVHMDFGAGGAPSPAPAPSKDKIEAPELPDLTAA